MKTHITHLLILLLLLCHSMSSIAQDTTNQPATLMLDSITGNQGTFIDTIIIYYTYADSENDEHTMADFQFSIGNTMQWQPISSQGIIGNRITQPGSHSIRWISSQDLYGISVDSLYLKFRLGDVMDNMNAQWKSKDSMTVERHYPGIGVVNGKLYVIGGKNGYDGYLSTVEEYDPATDTWTLKSPMPTKRCCYATSVFDGKIYAMGGQNGNFLNSVEAYDPLTDSWSTKSPMPSSRSGLASAVINNKMYAMGGYHAAATKLEEYDPVSDTWITKAPMPAAGGGLGVAAVNDKIYAFGGRGTENSVIEYDPITEKWETKNPMPTRRERLGVAAVNDKIYAIGGIGSRTLDVVERFNPLIDVWDTVASLNRPRMALSADVIDGTIYAAGGLDNSSALKDLEAIDVATSLYSNYILSPSLRVNIPDVLSPVHNLILYQFFVDSNTTALTWNSALIFSSDAESVGIWYKKGRFPDSAFNSSATLIGMYPLSVNADTIPADTSIDGYYSLFVVDQAGNWSQRAEFVSIKSPISIRDFRAVRAILDTNGLFDVPVSDVIMDTQAYRITGLSFSNRKLFILPEDIGKLTGLTTLNLDHNMFTSLPSGLRLLDKLNVLRLDHNQLSSIPPAITGIQTLNKDVGLNINNNKLCLSDSIKNWANRYDEDWQYYQDNADCNDGVLFINNKDHSIFKNGFIGKSILIIEPKGQYIEQSLYLSYTDQNKFYPNRFLEINHHFKLPQGSAVHDLWLWMGNEVMQAQMFDVQTAQAIYDSIVNAPVRIDPALLKKEGSTYYLSIYPYESGKFGKVKLSFITPLALDNDTAHAELPLSMLLQNNKQVKTVDILFKEKQNTFHAPVVEEHPLQEFIFEVDSLGYRYSQLKIDDITYLSKLSLTYMVDQTDHDTSISAKMLAYESINNLSLADTVDTAAIINSSLKYNVLTDFTSLLALEPDQNFQFLVNPLDEGNFIPPLIYPAYTSVVTGSPTGKNTGIVDKDKIFNITINHSAMIVMPNPFISSTEFVFTTEARAAVTLEIYNTHGVRIQLLFDGIVEKGRYTIKWNGITDSGEDIEPGIYFYSFTINEKMYYGMLIKIQVK